MPVAVANMLMRPGFCTAPLLVACDFTGRLTGLLARYMYTSHLAGESQDLPFVYNVSLFIAGLFSNGLSNINIASDQDYPEDGNEVSF